MPRCCALLHLMASASPHCRLGVVAEQLRGGTLRRVLTAWEPPASTIYALYPGSKLISMKVRAFVDHLARRVGRTPYWEDGL
jgi:DNA-binding transcriptional LysR family regulator